jgi:phage baseplate assembly protein W/nucleoid-associated protein YgaU
MDEATTPGKLPVAEAIVTVEGDSTQRSQPLPFYTFEIYNPEGMGSASSQLVDSAELGKVTPQVALRIPPSSLRISAPIRAEVSMDLANGITVAHGGMGIRRWTLSGSHGVGLGPKIVAQAKNGGFAMSGGYAVRTALVEFFEAWVSANDKRKAEGKPLLRMLFAIRNGTLTEFQNEEWWIQPDSLPEESRSASKPLAWEWSLSFQALARRSKRESATSFDALMPASSRAVEDAVEKASAAADKVIAKAQKSRLQYLLEKAKALKDGLESIKGRVSSAVSLYRNGVSGVSDYIRSTARIAQETLLLVNRSNLFDQPSRELFNSIREIQTALGLAQLLADGYLEPFYASSSMPTTTSIQPGDTLQAVASRELGDSSRWPELVAVNELSYPYIDFSGPEGSPDPSFPGKVLGKGDTLKLPDLGGNVVPDDPIGTDMDEVGDLATLIAGVDNIRGALLRRLRTPKGYLPHHPEYGSDLSTYIGKPLTPAVILSIRAEVERTLMADHRVVGVASVGVTVDADAINVEAAATTLLGPTSMSLRVKASA